MNQFEIQQSRERERAVESKESREAEKDPELQMAASKERADYLVKEVKSNQKQVQNIIIHVMQVRQALKKLRDELQLSAQGDSSSVQQDEARVAILKKQIGEYVDELVAMKEDLISFEIEELRKIDGSLNEDTLTQKAHDKVVGMLSILQE